MKFALLGICLSALAALVSSCGSNPDPTPMPQPAPPVYVEPMK